VSHPGEIFSIEELNELDLTRLRRVAAYLGVDFSMSDKRTRMVERIMEFQYPKNEINWDGNPDWKPGVQRSARVQRLYELNVLKKKL
jgi:hypothetical protein